LAAANRRASWKAVFKNWALVYAGNLVGSILLALMIFYSQHYLSGNGIIGETMFKVALGKIHYSFFSALVLGILCNMFVCLAVWLAYASKSIGDKFLVILPPITAFVALGFEHSVANMYLLSSAWLVKVLDPSFAAAHHLILTDLNLYTIIIKNLIPVTLGNIIGGLFIWFAYRSAYKK